VLKSGVVLMKSGEKKWKSEKKLQKVKGNIWSELWQFFWHGNCWQEN
jgi:hypothetical protein